MFNITSFIAGDQVNVWTSAQDRNVILWPLVDNHVPKEVLGIPEMENPLLCLPTMGGFVYSTSVSPLDSSHMALGLGDGSIRLWNMAAGKPDMSMLWNGIKGMISLFHCSIKQIYIYDCLILGKVTAIAWHPAIEGRLAFGTDEGRVGIFDTLNMTKPPLLSRTYHKGTVYNLAWAPMPSKEDVLFLYSCGGSHILIHDPSALDAEAKNFNRSIDDGDKKAQKFPSRTDIQWKTDYSLVAVGNEDGSVEIYSGRSLSLLLIIVAHKKLIQCLKWHPTFTFQSAEASKMSNWLAVASNDTSIKSILTAIRFSFMLVLQYLLLKNIVFSVNDQAPASFTLVATLSGHKERVVSVAWNPHKDGSLLSASYDGTAQVKHWPASSSRSTCSSTFISNLISGLGC